MAIKLTTDERNEIAAIYGPSMPNRAWSTRRSCAGTTTNSIYIGRPSFWGNPFVIGKDGTRNNVIAKYEAWLSQQPKLLARLDQLKGKHLICWCSPQRCHGDVPVRPANAPQSPVRLNLLTASAGVGADTLIAPRVRNGPPDQSTTAPRLALPQILGSIL